AFSQPARARALPPALFPYTTLFRSRFRHWEQPMDGQDEHQTVAPAESARADIYDEDGVIRSSFLAQIGAAVAEGDTAALKRDVRSEEHTSELQSRENLVCRLLLEKK